MNQKTNMTNPMIIHNYHNHYPSYEPVETIRRTEPKIGRNQSCPCGSGKKYKKCCLITKA